MLSGSLTTTVRFPTRSSREKFENQPWRPLRGPGGAVGGAVTQESTHCRARSSWRRTEHRRARILQTQNNERPRRLSLGLQRRSPDRLSQRRGTETGAARKESESGQEILLEPTSETGFPSLTRAWKELLTLSISPIILPFFLRPATTLHLFLYSVKYQPTNLTISVNLTFFKYIVLECHDAALLARLIWGHGSSFCPMLVDSSP